MLAGTFRQQRIFLNAIRFLANDLKAPLVCAGTELARQALLTDPQLAERFEALRLARWANDRPLAQLLASLASILPLRRPSDLETAAVRKRVLELTEGVTVRIFRLIETAAVEAIRSGAECITTRQFRSRRLVLPLVAMTRTTEARLTPAGRGMMPRASFCRSRRGRSRMNCSRPGRDASPADTTFAPTVSRNGLASRVTTGPSAFRGEISLPRPPPSPPGREPAGFPKGGCGRWRSRPARDRWACTSGGRGGRSERSEDPFVPRAWRRTPTPAGTITFAGPGRWSSAAYATGTVGFCRKRAPHCHSALGFRFRNRGGARLVCIQCQSAVRGLPAVGDAASPGIQGFFQELSPLFAGSIECPPSTACAVLRAARLLWASPRARGRARPPSSRASRPTFPVRHWPGRRRTGASPWPRRRGVADGDAARRRAAPRSRRREARLGFRAVHARPTGAMDGRGRPGARARSDRPVASGPVRLGKPLRAPEEYRRLAETILASEEWRNARAGPPGARRRTLGLLVSRALG